MLYSDDEASAAFNSLRASTRRAKEPTAHLSYEEKRAYVRNEADPLERELVESHTAICPDCAAELRSLFDFAMMIQANPATAKQSAWKRFIGAIGLSGGWSGLKIAVVTVTAALLVAVTVSIWLLLRNNESSSSSSKLARSSESPSREVPNSNAAAPSQPAPPSRGGAPVTSARPPENRSDILIVTLNPSMISEIGQPNIVYVKPEHVTVYFRLAGVDASFNRYKATLMTLTGTEVLRPILRMDKQNMPSVEIPASAVASGYYLLKLSKVIGPGNEEFTAVYPIKIVK